MKSAKGVWKNRDAAGLMPTLREINRIIDEPLAVDDWEGQQHIEKHHTVQQAAYYGRNNNRASALVHDGGARKFQDWSPASVFGTGTGGAVVDDGTTKVVRGSGEGAAEHRQDFDNAWKDIDWATEGDQDVSFRGADFALSGTPSSGPSRSGGGGGDGGGGGGGGGGGVSPSAPQSTPTPPTSSATANPPPGTTIETRLVELTRAGAASGLTLHGVRRQLEHEFGVDLSGYKTLLKDAVQQILGDMASEQASRQAATLRDTWKDGRRGGRPFWCSVSAASLARAATRIQCIARGRAARQRHAGAHGGGAVERRAHGVLAAAARARAAAQEERQRAAALREAQEAAELSRRAIQGYAAEQIQARADLSLAPSIPSLPQVPMFLTCFTNIRRSIGPASCSGFSRTAPICECKSDFVVAQTRAGGGGHATGCARARRPV